AVELESVSLVRVRYLIVVSTLASKQESILLGMDFPSSDSGFSVTSAEDTKNFKPVSMQTM
ncbi:hypothetical protein XENOCAPTIV_024984, partial [Xenoophorus captivus]